MPQPRVFIASSTEGHHIAELLQLGLDSHAECTIWSQGVFGLSGGTLESLCDLAHSFDFALLVLTPDDLVQKRSGLRPAPRDNVLFELGLFMGSLGRQATFIVSCADDPLELPSDIVGVTTVRWRRRSDGNLRAALGPACTQIRLAIEMQGGIATRPSFELDQLRAQIENQSRDIRSLVETINRGFGLKIPASPGDGALERLTFLEGSWRNPEVGTHAYPRVVDGTLRWPYCYSSNHRLTGEYYDFVRAGDILTARFRWLGDRPIRGCSYLQIRSRDELVGGWWYDSDLDVERLRRHPLLQQGAVPISNADDGEYLVGAEGMNPNRLIRVPHGEVPQWALDYYERLRAAPRGPS